MAKETPMILDKTESNLQMNPPGKDDFKYEQKEVIKNERKQMKDRSAIQVLIKRMELKLSERRDDGQFITNVLNAENKLMLFQKKIELLKDIESNWKTYNYLYGDGLVEDVLEV
jgi:hypothetical protein